MDTRKRNHLYRVQQKAIIVGIVSFIVVLVMLFVYLLSVWVKGDLSVIKMLKRSIFVVVTIMMVVGCVYSVIMIIWWIKCIHQNVTGKTSISREYFKELDYLRNHWKETNTLFKKRIGSIKYFYNGAIMQELVEQKRLDILYDRHFELLNRFEFKKDWIAIEQGIAASVVYTNFSAVIHNIFVAEFNFLTLMTMILGYICILGIIFIVANRGNIWRGQDSSLVYELNSYELKLLEKKIAKIEENVEMSDEEYKLERTWRVLQEVILKKRRACSLNEEIIKDLEVLQGLDILYSGEMGMMYKKEIGVVFPGETKETREVILEQNKELKVLYSLLKKYGFN